MGCSLSKQIVKQDINEQVMNLTSIKIDVPLKCLLPIHFKQSTEPIDFNQSDHFNQPDHFNQSAYILDNRDINKETIMLIKYEIANPQINNGFVSYGSHTLTDMCLKNQQQSQICDSIMFHTSI